MEGFLIKSLRLALALAACAPKRFAGVVLRYRKPEREESLLAGSQLPLRILSYSEKNKGDIV